MSGPPSPGQGAGNDLSPQRPPPASQPSSQPQDSRWPYDQGPTAADEAADTRVLQLADAFIKESQRVRTLQIKALGLAAAVVFALIVLLCGVVKVGFADHLGKAEGMLIRVAEQTVPPSLAASASNAPALLSASSVAAPTTAASAAQPSGEHDASSKKSLHDLLAIGLKSLAYSTVAVISILVIAITILTLGVAKVVFAMAPHRMTDDARASASEPGKVPTDSAVVLPNLEFAKEFASLVADLFKRQSKG